MASRIAYLSSVVIAAALVGCGGEDSGEQPSEAPKSTYAFNVPLGDRSHLASTVTVYGKKSVSTKKTGK